MAVANKDTTTKIYKTGPKIERNTILNFENDEILNFRRATLL
jgi:hypothetical protein